MSQRHAAAGGMSRTTVGAGKNCGWVAAALSCSRSVLARRGIRGRRTDAARHTASVAPAALDRLGRHERVTITRDTAVVTAELSSSDAHASSSDARRFDPPVGALAAAAVLVAACQWLSCAAAATPTSLLHSPRALRARAPPLVTAFASALVADSSLAKGVLVTNVTIARPARAPTIVPPSSCPHSRSCSPCSCSRQRPLLVTEPGRVRHVAIVNRGDIPITVAVSSGTDDGVQLLGTVEPASTHTVQDLFDQGSSWRFSFSSAGVDLGSVRASRAALADQGWRFVVPASVLDRLSRTAR